MYFVHGPPFHYQPLEERTGRHDRPLVNVRIPMSLWPTRRSGAGYAFSQAVKKRGEKADKARQAFDRDSRVKNADLPGRPNREAGADKR